MSYDGFETLKISIDGPIAVVTIDREPALNALSSTVISELAHAAGELEVSQDVRVVILTGAGDKAFVAGADIAEMLEMTPAQAHAFAQMGGAVGNAIETSDKAWRRESKSPIMAATIALAIISTHHRHDPASAPESKWPGHARPFSHHRMRALPSLTSTRSSNRRCRI